MLGGKWGPDHSVWWCRCWPRGNLMCAKYRSSCSFVYAYLFGGVGSDIGTIYGVKTGGFCNGQASGSRKCDMVVLAQEMSTASISERADGLTLTADSRSP